MWVSVTMTHRGSGSGLAQRPVLCRTVSLSPHPRCKVLFLAVDGIGVDNGPAMLAPIHFRSFWSMTATRRLLRIPPLPGADRESSRLNCSVSVGTARGRPPKDGSAKSITIIRHHVHQTLRVAEKVHKSTARTTTTGEVIESIGEHTIRLCLEFNSQVQ